MWRSLPSRGPGRERERQQESDEQQRRQAAVPMMLAARPREVHAFPNPLSPTVRTGTRSAVAQASPGAAAAWGRRPSVAWLRNRVRGRRGMVREYAPCRAIRLPASPSSACTTQCRLASCPSTTRPPLRCSGRWAHWPMPASPPMTSTVSSARTAPASPSNWASGPARGDPRKWVSPRSSTRQPSSPPASATWCSSPPAAQASTSIAPQRRPGRGRPTSSWSGTGCSPRPSSH